MFSVPLNSRLLCTKREHIGFTWEAGALLFRVLILFHSLSFLVVAKLPWLIPTVVVCMRIAHISLYIGILSCS